MTECVCEVHLLGSGQVQMQTLVGSSIFNTKIDIMRNWKVIKSNFIEITFSVYNFRVNIFQTNNLAITIVLRVS